MGGDPSDSARRQLLDFLAERGDEDAAAFLGELLRAVGDRPRAVPPDRAWPQLEDFVLRRMSETAASQYLWLLQLRAGRRLAA